MIITSTIVISTLAGMIPAWRAARLRPVEALRAE
jgi:lipoprotein-releasing system permease protein